MDEDLPLASDEAHAQLYEIACEALDELELEKVGGSDCDSAPPTQEEGVRR